MLAQFLKFSLVGLLNTAIDYGVFHGLWYVGVYHLLASGIGFLLAVTNSYFINRHWTFKSRTSNIRQEFMRFMIVNLVTLSINLIGMAILVELFSVYAPYAKLVTIGLTLIINFLGNKFWTFR